MYRNGLLEHKAYKKSNHIFYITHISMENLTIFIFFIIALFKGLIYEITISPEFFIINPLYSPIFASILPIAAIAILFSGKKRVAFLFIMDLISSIILFSDTVYYRYYKDVISIGILRNGFLLKDVSSSIAALIKWSDFIYIFDIFFLAPLLVLSGKLKYKSCRMWKRIIICLVLFTTGVTLDGKFIYNLSKEQPRLLTTMYNKLYIAKSLGNFNYHLVDLYNFTYNQFEKAKGISASRKQEIQVFFQNKNTPNKAVLNGAGEGKNLIIIQVEALQQFVINSKINNEEITPNLNRWINKSLYFDNYYYQVSSGNTSDAEFMSNNSLYPASIGAAYYKYSNDTLDSLPKAMSDKGYNTAAFHGYYESFWNRNIMYKTEGFDNFYGEKSFKIDEKVGLGLSDRSFLNQSLEKIKELEKPYFSFLVTLSSHFPYDDAAGYGEFDEGNYQDTLLGNYLKAIHYTDAQLGMFLDKLDEDGILNDSIVVIYGDHNAIPKEYIDQLYKFENIENPTDFDWFQYQKVPMMIHFPGDAHSGINHTYSGQMDLYPTIANLFNLSNKFMFGKDILNSSNGEVIFRNGSFTDGSVVYISNTDTYYDIKSGNTIPETPDLKILKEKVLDELNYSDDVLNHNLIRNFMETSSPDDNK